MTEIESYMGRELRGDEPVWVYRNLSHGRDGVWYSVMQRGVVIGHTKSIDLRDCTFRVRPGGRRRTIDTGVKNVHAFVIGMVAGQKAKWVDFGEALSGRYNPNVTETFQVVEPDGGTWASMKSARAARLDSSGLVVWSAR